MYFTDADGSAVVLKAMGAKFKSKDYLISQKNN
jgi:hypothetical protein